MAKEIDFDEFLDCLSGVYDSPTALEMKDISQHSQNVSCYDHCLYVAFVSFVMAKRTGLDYRAAARGAMLHDLYLANWEDTDIGLFERLVLHPKMAYENACGFGLSVTEQDIIINHMWPLTPKMPKTPEGKIVSLADKICAGAEMLGLPAPVIISARLQARMKEKRRAVTAE